MDAEAHWQNVYTHRASNEVSWYRPHLDRSLQFVQESQLPKDARILDVGGGASTLVDDLLEAGYRDVTVMDLADAALQSARHRLGERAREVRWIVGDVARALLPEHSVDFWHDRAVFHFLTDEQARSAYLAQLHRCLVPGGYVMMATFAPDGPEKCSGLPVARYDAEAIHAALGQEFEKVGEANEVHRTPAGGEQSFAYCLCRRLPSGESAR